MSGVRALQRAEWLLGFDFDGTLADITQGHSVAPGFFTSLLSLREVAPIAWGICTGRSLEFLIEGMEQAQFPFYPDFIVSQERDIHYRIGDEVPPEYQADTARNSIAQDALMNLLEQNAQTLAKIREFVETQTQAQWISIPEDPAGIIATTEEEVAAVVARYHACADKSDQLDFQRSTIYLRFSHNEFCKGTAIQHLQRKFSIQHGNTLVMGDNYNDLSMLNSKVARLYGAPVNAVPALKDQLAESGGFITQSSYTEGVVEALEELLARLHEVKIP